MKVSDDLTALVFELQRARSPVEKGRILARAWRTIRGLSATERRLLVREVGFDGAEDLVDGLAGKSGGTFAPAAVLEALGRMRKDESLTVRGILADLRDPDRREDLLVRGIDLVMGDEMGDGDDEEEDVPLWSDGAVELQVPHRHPDGEPIPEALEVQRPAGNGEREILSGEPVEPKLPPPPPVVENPEEDSAPPPEPPIEAKPEPEPTGAEEETTVWDAMWDGPVPVPDRQQERTRKPAGTVRTGQTSETVLQRLRVFREGIVDLHGGGETAVLAALETLIEPWAKRRAMVALIEAGVLDDVSVALDLIGDLDRAMDRRWCLSALARHGDLQGPDLERALEMLTSPAAKRRVAGLARG